jgi:hypothetical protein
MFGNSGQYDLPAMPKGSKCRQSVCTLPYRLALSGVNLALGEVLNKGHTKRGTSDIRHQTDRHTGVGIELLRN